MPGNTATPKPDAFDYDLFVIGGGSGGVRAGRVAAETGAKVALAEEYRMGGTCVIRGCVPKKLMVFASAYGPAVEEARAYGWDYEGGRFNWDRFRPKLAAELDRLEGIYRGNLARAGVTEYNARATLKDPHTVALSTGEELTAKHILLAMGGTPYVPQFDGCDLAITSNDIFSLDRFPERILIVGGGYIACEFATIFRGLGAHVAQWYRGAQILRGFDDEVRGHLAEIIRGHGVDLHVGAEVERMERRDGQIWVKGTDGREDLFDQVLYATGRHPKTASMGLEEAGVKLGRWGEVVVDDYGQTSVPSVYAVGDVTNRIQLTPVAIREGMAFVETVFNGTPTKPDHALVASAVFTQPEYGCTGAVQAGGVESHRQGARLPYRRRWRRRDDPARRCGDQDGRHQGRFRPHRGGASDHGGRNRAAENPDPKPLTARTVHASAGGRGADRRCGRVEKSPGQGHIWPDVPTETREES